MISTKEAINLAVRVMNIRRLNDLRPHLPKGKLLLRLSIEGEKPVEINLKEHGVHAQVGPHKVAYDALRSENNPSNLHLAGLSVNDTLVLRVRLAKNGKHQIQLGPGEVPEPELERLRKLVKGNTQGFYPLKHNLQVEKQNMGDTPALKAKFIIR